MFENLMRKKFYEKKLFLTKNNETKIVDDEVELLYLVKTKDSLNLDYVDGTLTVQVGGAL